MSNNDFYDSLLEKFDPEEVKKTQEEARIKGERLNNLIHQVFEQSSAGKELLEVWKDSLLMQPCAEPGMGEVEIGIREGQKRFIRSIILTVKRVENS